MRSESTRLVLVCGFLSAVGWAFVSWMTHGLPAWAVESISSITFGQFPKTVGELANGFGYEVDNHRMPTPAYLVAQFLLFGLALIPTIAIARSRMVSAGRPTLIAVLVFGTVFRLTLIPSAPIHENDFYRYLWDGKSSAHGINPYLFAPADVAAAADPIGSLFANPLEGHRSPESLTPVQEQALHSLVELRHQYPNLHRRIGHPHIPTIYPPASQLSFLTAEWLTGGSVTGWKIIVAAFDLGVCALIVLLLSSVGKNPAMVIVYAWCPLVLKEFSNSGHHDPIPIFFSLLAILLALRHHRIFSTIALSVATLGKFFPITLVPVLDPPTAKFSVGIRYLVFGFFIIAAYVPFLFWQSTGFDRVFAGLGIYNEDWQFFSGIFALVHHCIQLAIPDASYLPAKSITALMFAGVVIWVSLRLRKREATGLDIVGGCFVVFGTLFVLNATSFPWYFGWVVPFLCIFPHPAWIALGGLLPLTYLSFHPAWDIPMGSAFWLGFPALSWLVWGGFFIALMTCAVVGRTRRPNPESA